MEGNVKKIFDINCNWFMHGSSDASGNSKNGWSGEVLLLANNSCIGFATDNGHQAPTHLLVGSFVDGNGMSICKIHATNNDYDPIIFDAFVNSNGAENTYYGEFLAKTFFNFVPMGIASIETKEKPFDRNNIEKIASKYNDMSEVIKSKVGISALTLNEYSELDYDDMATKIQIVANSNYHNELPDVLLNKAGSQPSSN